jgi:PmbA protein
MTKTNQTPFYYDQPALAGIAHKLLDMAKAFGATDASSEVSEHAGLSVSVRMGSLETIEQTRDRSAAVSVYKGHRRGHATTSDLSDQALAAAVKRALDIASHTAEDAFSGLPEKRYQPKQQTALDLFHPWAVRADQAADLALAAEAAARSVSPLIKNSEGAGVSASHGQFFSANSAGFSGGYPYSRHWISVAPIAQRGAAMQRDDWYTTSRKPSELASPQAIGRYAAQRALSRLGAKKIPTGQWPVIFEAPLAVGLMGSLVHALSGSALYRRASFLLDAKGQRIFPDHIDIHEDPFIPGAAGSAPFDDEGVAVQSRQLVEAGVVQGYFLSMYTARKLSLEPTGHAGGAHNLRLTSRQTRPQDDLAGLLKTMGKGLLVTEVMGQGVNGLTGDYSRGAFGYWVENGQIVHPVEEITIAGNLKDMYAGIVAVGSDEITRGTKTTGSILLDRMTIAGS